MIVLCLMLYYPGYEMMTLSDSVLDTLTLDALRADVNKL